MYRTEYPRPQFQRDSYLILNGEWQFATDRSGVSLSEKWQSIHYQLPGKIEVPFCMESLLSGIGDSSPCSRVFYKKKVELPDSFLQKDKRVLLHFGAVDYACKVFVNGFMVGEHRGGHVSFSFDITDFLTADIQDISLFVEDPFDDEALPRGKQFWEEQSRNIWYTRTTGIWQTVWLEAVHNYSIKQIKFTPLVDSGSVLVEAAFSHKNEQLSLQVDISLEGTLFYSDLCRCNEDFFSRNYLLTGKKIFRTNAHGGGIFWSPEHPKLFDVTFTLFYQDKIVDQVHSYFGMRKIHTEKGMIFLNNRPYYMKLVLDQGYWPQGLMTAPSDEDFVTDIRLAKEMGFNGCRKHQKVEDPRFLYWADKLGFLVWGEVPAPCIFTSDAVERTMTEWMEAVKRDYNHPCIVAWVPLNESWGVSQIKYDKQQQQYSLALYHMLKSLDSTRLVVNNDGWEMTVTDICAVHNYHHGEDGENDIHAYFKKQLSDFHMLLHTMPAGRSIYADKFSYRGEPVLLTEFGGIAFDLKSPGAWGYTVAADEEDFCRQYERVLHAVLESDILYGFCYTQLTDIEQEVNGLLTYDRKPKIDPEKIRKINEKWRHNMRILEEKELK